MNIYVNNGIHPSTPHSSTESETKESDSKLPELIDIPEEEYDATMGNIPYSNEITYGADHLETMTFVQAQNQQWKKFCNPNPNSKMDRAFVSKFYTKKSLVRLVIIIMKLLRVQAQAV